MKNRKYGLSILIRRVAAECGYERAAVCASDCLLQWESGGDKLFDDTYSAWERYLVEKIGGQPHSSCNRWDAWVPAIPL